MLKEYEKCGYLQMEPAKHEAYITEPALHTITRPQSSGYAYGEKTEADVNKEKLHFAKHIPETVRRLRTYAGFIAQREANYLKQNFAVHVVQYDEPHDLLYTLLIETRRRWLWPFCKQEYIEVINY